MTLARKTLNQYDHPFPMAHRNLDGQDILNYTTQLVQPIRNAISNVNRAARITAKHAGPPITIDITYLDDLSTDTVRVTQGLVNLNPAVGAIVIILDMQIAIDVVA